MDADGSLTYRSTRLPARARAIGSLLLATLSWSMLAPFVRVGEGVEVTNLAQYLAEQRSAPGQDRLERELRAKSPAWSLWYRMFAALAHVNLALQGAWYAHGELDQVDAILDDTLSLEREQGAHYFLAAQGKRAEPVRARPQSASVDGAIALMIAARQLAARELAAHSYWQDPEHALAHASGPAPREELTDELRVRLASSAERMEESPLLCAESWPC
jgi:hypothetical protein